MYSLQVHVFLCTDDRESISGTQQDYLGTPRETEAVLQTWSRASKPKDHRRFSRKARIGAQQSLKCHYHCS